MLCLLQEAFVHSDPAMAHSNILPVLQVFEDTESVHLVMELCQRDLTQQLGSHKALSEFDIAKAFKCMASGLQQCHSCGKEYSIITLPVAADMTTWVAYRCHAWRCEAGECG